nr:hypothetical protein [Kitasatospora fiedleri]
MIATLVAAKRERPGEDMTSLLIAAATPRATAAPSPRTNCSTPSCW